MKTIAQWRYIIEVEKSSSQFKTLLTTDGRCRRVGVEIEMAGIPPMTIARALTQIYGGEARQNSAVNVDVKNTIYGDFHIELDSSYLQALAEENGSESRRNPWSDFAVSMIAKAAEHLIPWEVVTPPMEISQLARLESFVDVLRKSGALGTRHALHFAFGLHLNPEVPDLSTMTILNYLRAYFCLYEWIEAQENIDLTRKLTTYIKHFRHDYILHVLNPHYQPNRNQLIDDYLLFNPSRNRSLDMLPLFAHLDFERVKRVVDDPRIKARPTFHYRLPNCDIDNPKWNISLPWSLWMEVEKLAHQPVKLEKFCRDYCEQLKSFTHLFDHRWLDYLYTNIKKNEEE